MPVRAVCPQNPTELIGSVHHAPIASLAAALPPPPCTPHASCQPLSTSRDAWEGRRQQDRRRDGLNPNPAAWPGCLRHLPATQPKSRAAPANLSPAPSGTTCPAQVTELQHGKRAGRRRALGLQREQRLRQLPGTDICRSLTNKYHCSLSRH